MSDRQLRALLHWAAIGAIVGSLITIMATLPFDSAIAAARHTVTKLGVWGPVALAGAYVVATVLFVPGTILTLVAGAAFGLVVGMVTVSVGSVVGASAAFLIARYLAREKVAALAVRRPRFQAIDRAIGEAGWKIVALLRLSPAIPFNLQNYLYGLTPIRFWPYVLTSWIAMLPGTFLYVYLGHVTGAALGSERERSVGEWALLGVGLLATLVATVYITRLARKRLQTQVDDAATSEVDSSPTPPPGQSAWPKTILLLGVSLVMILVAVLVWLNKDALRERVNAWTSGVSRQQFARPVAAIDSNWYRGRVLVTQAEPPRNRLNPRVGSARRQPQQVTPGDDLRPPLAA